MTLLTLIIAALIFFLAPILIVALLTAIGIIGLHHTAADAHDDIFMNGPENDSKPYFKGR